MPTAVQPRVKLRALRFPAVPATLLVQLGGGASALTGVYLAWGLAALLIVGGVATVVLGALREAGKV
jgi:hypothetical protein